jgi:hypothetical protein
VSLEAVPVEVVSLPVRIRSAASSMTEEVLPWQFIVLSGEQEKEGKGMPPRESIPCFILKRGTRCEAAAKVQLWLWPTCCPNNGVTHCIE